jgi:hypothetical protein
MTEDAVSLMFLEKKVNFDQPVTPKSPRRRLQKSTLGAADQPATRSYSAVAASTLVLNTEIGNGEQAAKLQCRRTKEKEKEEKKWASGANASSSSSGARQNRARQQEKHPARGLDCSRARDRGLEHGGFAESGGMPMANGNGVPVGGGGLGGRTRGLVCYNCQQSGHFASACPGIKRGPGVDVRVKAFSRLSRNGAAGAGEIGREGELGKMDPHFVCSTADPRRRKLQSGEHDKMLPVIAPRQVMRKQVEETAGTGPDEMHAQLGAGEAREFDGFYPTTPDLRPRPPSPRRSNAWAGGGSLSGPESRWGFHGYHARQDDERGQARMQDYRQFAPARSFEEMPTGVRANGMYPSDMWPESGQLQRSQAPGGCEGRRSAEYYHSEPQKGWPLDRIGGQWHPQAHSRDECTSPFEYSRADHSEREVGSSSLHGPNYFDDRRYASARHAHRYAPCERGGKRTLGDRDWRGYEGQDSVGRHEFHPTRAKRTIQDWGDERGTQQQARYDRGLPTAPQTRR